MNDENLQQNIRVNEAKAREIRHDITNLKMMADYLDRQVARAKGQLEETE